MIISTARGLNDGLWDGLAACVRNPPGGTRVWLLLLPRTRFPARATQGVEGGAVSRKEARDGAGNTVPRPLMPLRLRLRSRDRAGNRVPGRCQGTGSTGRNSEALVIHSFW